MSQPNQSNWGVPLAGLILGALIPTLSVTSINVAIPALMAAFHVDAGGVQWVINIYTLTIGVVIPLSTWIIVRMGHKKAYLAALAVFAVGSVLCALAPNLSVLILARIIQATGGGILIPVTVSFIYRLVPAEKIGTAMGFWGIAIMSAPTFGPTLGGYLVERFGWYGIFWLNVPPAVLGLLLGAVLLNTTGPEEDADKGFDVGGFITLGIGLFSLQLALGKVGSLGWSAGPVVLLLGASAASLAAFTWHELRCRAPMLNLRLARNRTFAASAMYVMTLSGGLTAVIFYTTILLQNVMGLSPTQSGLVLLPGAVVSAVLQPLSGRLYDRNGPRALVVVGTVMVTISTFLFSRISVQTPPATLAWLTVVQGAGVGLAYMPAMTAGLSAVSGSAVAQASSMINIVMRVGGSLALPLMTLLHSSRVSQYAPTAASPDAAYLEGLRDVFLVSAAIAALGVICGALLTKGHPESQELSPKPSHSPVGDTAAESAERLNA